MFWFWLLLDFSPARIVWQPCVHHFDGDHRVRLFSWEPPNDNDSFVFFVQLSFFRLFGSLPFLFISCLYCASFLVLMWLLMMMEVGFISTIPMIRKSKEDTKTHHATTPGELETSKLSVRERMCISNFLCDCKTCINSKIYFIWWPLKISHNLFVFVSGSFLGVEFAFALNLRISIRQMKTSRGWVVSCGRRRLFIRFPDINSRLHRRNFLCEVSTVVV